MPVYKPVRAPPAPMPMFAYCGYGLAAAPSLRSFDGTELISSSNIKFTQWLPT